MAFMDSCVWPYRIVLCDPLACEGYAEYRLFIIKGDNDIH